MLNLNYQYANQYTQKFIFLIKNNDTPFVVLRLVMIFEVDFLPVGEASSSGDAICIRYSEDSGRSWYVGVIDGGTQEAGQAICDHVRTFYETENVDFVISTHPDQDHASGLSIVLEKLNVQKIFMHCPWDYIDSIYDRVKDGRVTKESLRQRLISGHPYAYNVYRLALEKQIPIHHPFSDNANNHNIPFLNIVGPSIDFYVDQLTNFRAIDDITEDESILEGLLANIAAKAKGVTRYISENLYTETLVDPAENATSNENNSSVISMFDFNGIKILLTADAGVQALTLAADRIEQLGYQLADFSLLQIPHHGSKRNIGPTILNRLIGPTLHSGGTGSFNAFISAAVEGEPKHPNKRVVNALIRRGGEVSVTRGRTLSFYSGTPNRGWPAPDTLSFYTEVEDDD